MAFLKVDNLSVFFPIYEGIFKRVASYFEAAKNVSFELDKGDALAIIGESGSGKTTIGNAILGLIEPTDGKLLFESQDLKAVQFRGKIQAVFQNPYSSLNPRQNVLMLVGEPLKQIQPDITKKELLSKVRTVLDIVGIDTDEVYRYPHQFSGGQRQRISIARALISEPELLVLDEPVSSLDVSIRAQILNLLADLQKKNNLTYIYISHDLATVRFISKKVLIIYKGRVMEYGDVEAIFDNPINPYTRLLLRSARDIIVETEAVKRAEAPLGCPFYDRCPIVNSVCAESFPKCRKIKENHYVYCHKSH